MKFTDHLFELQEVKYADFQSMLTPNVERERFIGVRVPLVRKYAKEIKKDPDIEEFMNAVPHYYFDENMLHGVLITEIKNYDECVEAVEKFLPYVDNWAVCDTMSPKIFKKYRDRLIEKVKEWSSSNKVYTCRFGLGMLMQHYLDDDFQKEYLEIPAKIISEEYYVNMMIAWYYATALAKQWDETIKYIEEKRLGAWVHNKTIQKACESYRITPEQKAYLRSLKVDNKKVAIV